MAQADVITQNPVCDVDSGTGQACGTDEFSVENWFARNFYIDQTVAIESVWWGCANMTTVSANIYFSVADGPGNPEDVTLTLVGTATQAVNAGPWYSTPVDIPFQVTAGSYLVVEFQFPDTGTDLGIFPACTETATETTYLKADDCGIPEYMDLAALGFPDAQMIMCLNSNVIDCNQNGIDDQLDIKSGFSYDCDDNLVPDECQPDCDGDGLIDPCDNEGDCDDDGIPDNCEADCQSNGIPDDCDILLGISEDVNNDGIPDECQDCNKNGIPDPVDIADGTSEDADGNGIPDECQYPVTWTVDDDGKADFDNIQAAIDAASSLPNHDDILVYPGTYPAGIDMLGKEVWLHSSDGPEVTIIDGEETQYGIVCQSGETNDTVIEGFTITRCKGSWPMAGAMICSWSSPTIINCVIDSNQVPNTNAAAIYCTDYSFPILSGCKITNNSNINNGLIGGSIFIWRGSHLSISDSILCGNFSTQISGSWTDLGGTCISVSCDDSDGDGWPDQCGTIEDGVHHVPDEFPTIQQAINAAGDHDEIIVAPGTYTTCEETMALAEAIMNPLGKRLWIHSSGGAEVTFIDAQGCNGALLLSGETTDLIIEGFTFSGKNSYPHRTSSFIFCAPTFKECIFKNSTDSDGAVVSGASAPVFEDCTFTSNTLAVSLSSYNIGGGSSSYECVGTASFTNCAFDNNNGSMINYGAAINMLDGVDLEVSNCNFENNSGASIIYMNSASDDSVFTDCGFRDNESSGGQFGGHIIERKAGHAGSLNIQRCLFENNSASSQLFSMGSAPNNLPPISISDSEFKNNTGSGIKTFIFGPNLNIENSTIKGNTFGGVSHYGFGDLTITNSTICSNEEYQIDSDEWIDGGGNSIAEVCFDDCHASDITDDGIVDVSDILAIIGYWGSSIPAGDVDGNGVVDIGDLLMVVGNWGPCE